MEIPTVCVCRCIPEAKGTIPLSQALFTMQYTDGNTDGLKLSVYSRGKGNCSPPQTVFNVQYTIRNTDGLKLSVYSRGERNCSPLPDTVHCAVYWWKHRRTQTVSVLQRRGELFPTPRHCSLCSTPIETPTVSNCQCIPEARGTVPLPQTLFIVQYTNENTDRLKPSVYSRGEGNYSHSHVDDGNY
jgi:hypothetical protein